VSRPFNPSSSIRKFMITFLGLSFFTRL
jgi:hypothetical protein